MTEADAAKGIVPTKEKAGTLEVTVKANYCDSIVILSKTVDIAPFKVDSELKKIIATIAEAIVRDDPRDLEGYTSRGVLKDWYYV